MNDLPANGAYPIFFWTGVSYANSAEEQERWQSFLKRNEAKLLAAMAANPREPSAPRPKMLSDYIATNHYFSFF